MDGILPALASRFWAKVNLGTADECWQWMGGTNGNGYGVFAKGYAHRFSYGLDNGPIPDGLTIDHLCRNRGCVNPAHMRVVTQKDNNLAGQGWGGRHSRATHCPKGHPYDLLNTKYKWKGTHIGRDCRACDRERHRKSQIIQRPVPGESTQERRYGPPKPWKEKQGIRR